MKLLSQVYDDRANKNHNKALENLIKADKLKPLDCKSLLIKAHVNMRLKKFSDSVVDARNAILLINKKDKYSTNDRNYLLYCAGNIGAYSQTKGYKLSKGLIEEQFVCVVNLKYDSSKVSKHIVDDFPFAKEINGIRS